MRRARGIGGRFAKKTHADASKNTTEGKGNDSGPGPTPQYGRSSGSERLPSDSAEVWVLPHGQQVARSSQVHGTSETNDQVNGGTFYHNCSGLQTSTRHSHSIEKRDEGDCSGQQRGRISSNQASQRPVAIQ